MYAARWAKMAVIYFVIGTSVGLYMVLSGLHQLPGLHAHLNLLGWASMGIVAALFRAFPSLEENKLTPIQFWLYQIFFPIMMIGLYLILTGSPQVGGPILTFTAIPVWLAIVLFGVSIFGSVQAGSSSTSVGRSESL